jgi:hypothetical protein
VSITLKIWNKYDDRLKSGQQAVFFGRSGWISTWEMMIYRYIDSAKAHIFLRGIHLPSGVASG